VAGDILAVLDELDREAAVGAAVVADAEALDDRSGLQAERLGARDEVGLEEGRHGVRSGRVTVRVAGCGRGRRGAAWPPCRAWGPASAASRGRGPASRPS